MYPYDLHVTCDVKSRDMYNSDFVKLYAVTSYSRDHGSVRFGHRRTQLSAAPHIKPSARCVEPGGTETLQRGSALEGSYFY